MDLVPPLSAEMEELEALDDLTIPSMIKYIVPIVQ